MRKFLSFAALLALLSGCAQADGVNEKLPVAVDAPETLYAEFDTESGDKEDETRTYVVDEWMLRWHEGDEISFFPVTYNMRYRFNGATGDNGGTFSKLTTDIVTGNELPTRYALYPYQDYTTISDEGRITYHFPDQQIYGEKSFGRGANVMVAATENHDDNVLRFKNVGGYLKLQIYSSEQRWLDYIELEGNNGERITGEAYIESSYGWDPWVEMSENAGTMLTLDCVDTEHWVDIAISTDPENPTDFWFVLPPTYFDNGITVRIYDTEGNICTKSTYNWIPVERNCIQPLSTFEFVADGGNQGGGNEDLELSSWSVIGSMTGWSNDIPMYILENYHVAYNVSMIAGDEFKFRKDSAWEFNYGGDFIGFGERSSAIGDGANIQIPEDGIYDIYFDSNALVFYIMYAGEVPSGGGVDEPVAPEGEVPYNQIWYTTLDESLLVPNNDDFGGAVVVSNTYENGLGVITFDRNVYRIGNFTFSDKHNLLTLNLPNCISDLASWTFASCSNLQEIVLPSSLQSMGGYTFSSCHSLQSVTFPDHTFGYGFCIFEECENISAFYGGGVLSDNRCYAPNGYAEFIATAGITEYAFPDEITGVGQFAFDMPNNLEVLIINENLQGFDCNLRFCDDLREFRGAHTSEDGYAIIIGDRLCSFVPNGISEYVVPDGVRVIGDFAFDCRDNITKVTLPDGVEEIYGFYGCYNLESINIPASVHRIGSQTFEGCESLRSIELPVGLTAIEHGTFNGCTSLTEIVIPRNVSRIDGFAFYNCTNLASVRLECVTPPELAIDLTGELGPLDNNAPGRIIYVPNQSVDAYMVAEGWSNYADSIVGYEYEEPVIPVNPEDCEWADVYLSLPTEEDAVNGWYPFQHVFIHIAGTDIVSGRYYILVDTEVTIEEILEYSYAFDPSWIDSINSSGSIRLSVGANPSMTVRFIIELTNANGDIVRFDRVITTTDVESHPVVEKWVGTWSLSADQVVNWTYVDGAYNGPTLIDQSATYDITIEAATDIAFDRVRVYGLTPLTTSNGEPISVLAYIRNDGYLFLESATAPIEQINESEFTYWLPYVQTSNGVEVLPTGAVVFVLSLSEDGLTATTAGRGSIEYNGEVCNVIGMDVFAFDGNTGAIREMFNPETMPEVNSPVGNITLTRTSSAAKAAYAPTKRASVANGTFKIEMVK